MIARAEMAVKKKLLFKVGQHGGGALPDFFSIATPSLREVSKCEFFLQPFPQEQSM